MNDQAVSQPGTVTLEPPSTVLNPQTVPVTSGGGVPSVSDAAGDEGSVESVLETELARLKSEDKTDSVKAEEKDKADEKDADKGEKADKAKEAKADDRAKDDKARQRNEDGKFAKADKGQEIPKDANGEKGAPEKAATERSAPDDRQSEGRKHAEPPARFLPEARTKWANTPNEVKAEVHRVAKEYETEIERVRPVVERYSQLREFDDLARSNGRDLRESLTKLNEVENTLQRNIIGGLNEVLREVGPRKADGSPLSIYEVAQFIVQQSPEQLARLSQTAQQQQAPQQNPHSEEMQQLRHEVQALRAEQTIVPAVQKFAGSHTDFEALSPQIHSILESGVIEKMYGTGLSLEQRLSEAYRMAGGSIPSSQSDPEAKLGHSDASPRPVNLDAGKKSIRGAPSDGADTETEEADTDLTTLLRKELRRMSA